MVDPPLGLGVTRVGCCPGVQMVEPPLGVGVTCVGCCPGVQIVAPPSGLRVMRVGCCPGVQTVAPPPGLVVIRVGCCPGVQTVDPPWESVVMRVGFCPGVHTVAPCRDCPCVAQSVAGSLPCANTGICQTSIIPPINRPKIAFMTLNSHYPVVGITRYQHRTTPYNQSVNSPNHTPMKPFRQGKTEESKLKKPPVSVYEKIQTHSRMPLFSRISPSPDQRKTN